MEGNNRRKGTPRNIWMDDMERDMSTLGVFNLRKQAEDGGATFGWPGVTSACKT